VLRDLFAEADIREPDDEDMAILIESCDLDKDGQIGLEDFRLLGQVAGNLAAKDQVRGGHGVETVAAEGFSPQLFCGWDTSLQAYWLWVDKLPAEFEGGMDSIVVEASQSLSTPRSPYNIVFTFGVIRYSTAEPPSPHGRSQVRVKAGDTRKKLDMTGGDKTKEGAGTVQADKPTQSLAATLRVLDTISHGDFTPIKQGNFLDTMKMMKQTDLINTVKQKISVEENESKLMSLLTFNTTMASPPPLATTLREKKSGNVFLPTLEVHDRLLANTLSATDPHLSDTLSFEKPGGGGRGGGMHQLSDTLSLDKPTKSGPGRGLSDTLTIETTAKPAAKGAAVVDLGGTSSLAGLFDAADDD
jgi:hypothetical protein